jgi:hypothetical protein
MRRCSLSSVAQQRRSRLKACAAGLRPSAQSQAERVGHEARRSAGRARDLGAEPQRGVEGVQLLARKAKPTAGARAWRARKAKPTAWAMRRGAPAGRARGAGAKAQRDVEEVGAVGRAEREAVPGQQLLVRLVAVVAPQPAALPRCAACENLATRVTIPPFLQQLAALPGCAAPA